MLFLMSVILLLSLLGTIVLSIGYFVYDINNKKIEQEERNNKKIRTEEELMSIIYSLLERKWRYRVYFHFKLKEIKVPKFEFEWKYLVNEIINSLSPDVLEELTYYYKDEETIIKTVSELVQIFLLDYMEKNGVKH